MKDVLIILCIVGGTYILIQLLEKKPILPWVVKKPTQIKKMSAEDELEELKKKPTTRNNKKRIAELEKKASELEKAWDQDISLPFRTIFPEIESFSDHMIKSSENRFTMVAEVSPVNYFLMDEQEKEQVDVIFESWIAQLEYPVRIYLQSRHVDLTEQIEIIQKTMDQQDNLYHKLKEYGDIMISNLKRWQNEQPRFETKRYLLFDIQINPKDVRVSEGEDFETRMYEKAFMELRRRLFSAQNQLRRSSNDVEMLSTEGIAEVLYYSFNRKKALKNRFKDVFEKEQLASFITSDQTAERIVAVKSQIEMNEANIDSEESNEKEKEMMPLG